MAEVTRVITIQMTTIFDDKEVKYLSPEQTKEHLESQYFDADDQDQFLVTVQDFVREDG